MSSTTPNPGRGSDATGGPHLTVEDTGSTTDAGALAHNDTVFHNDSGAGASSGSSSSSGDHVVAVAATTGDRNEAQDASSSRDAGSAAPTEHVASESVVDRGDAAATSSETSGTSGGPAGGLSALIGDDSIGHVFDQTNGVIDGLDGDSDGTADSDLHDSSERAEENPAFEQFADTEAASSPDTDDTRRTGA